MCSRLNNLDIWCWIESISPEIIESLFFAYNNNLWRLTLRRDFKSWHQEIDELLRIKKWPTMFLKTARPDQGHDNSREAPTNEVFKWTDHREFANLFPKISDALFLDDISYE